MLCSVKPEWMVWESSILIPLNWPALWLACMHCICFSVVFLPKPEIICKFTNCLRFGRLVTQSRIVAPWWRFQGLPSSYPLPDPFRVILGRSGKPYSYRLQSILRNLGFPLLDVVISPHCCILETWFLIFRGGPYCHFYPRHVGGFFQKIRSMDFQSIT